MQDHRARFLQAPKRKAQKDPVAMKQSGLLEDEKGALLVQKAPLLLEKIRCRCIKCT